MAIDVAEREKLIQQYADGPRKLKAALARVPEEGRMWRPAPGKWSVHEVICHCADSETNAAMRIRYLLAEKDPMIVGYDQDVWAITLNYYNHPLEPALAAVEAVRANTLALLRRLPEEAWKKQGRHTESGRYTAESWLVIYSEHLEKHTNQIESNLAAWQARQR